MFNPHLHEKHAQAHYHELLHEAEQQRMLDQLPRRRPQLTRNIARQFAAFLRNLPFFAKKTERSSSRRAVTGQL